MIQALTCREELVSMHQGRCITSWVGGYDFGKAVNRLAQIFDMKPQDTLFPGKQLQHVKARSLLCYWAVKELGISTTSVANKPGMHQDTIFPLHIMANEPGYALINRTFCKGLKTQGLPKISMVPGTPHRGVVSKLIFYLTSSWYSDPASPTDGHRRGTARYSEPVPWLADQ